MQRVVGGDLPAGGGGGGRCSGGDWSLVGRIEGRTGSYTGCRVGVSVWAAFGFRRGAWGGIEI